MSTYRFRNRDKEFGENSFSREVEFGGYSGRILGDEVVEECKMWAELLKVFSDGVKKPYSPVFELQKIKKEEHRTGEDLSKLKETIENCCSPSATVSDSLVYKDLREAIVGRIKDITGIEEYYK